MIAIVDRKEKAFADRVHVYVYWDEGYHEAGRCHQVRGPDDDDDAGGDASCCQALNVFYMSVNAVRL